MKAKTGQIIVRLPVSKKQELQEIANELKVDMSKLIRDKIDEIIMEYYEKKGLFDDEEDLDEILDCSFLKQKYKSNLSTQIINEDLINEMRNEFKKMFIDKMKKDINNVNTIEYLQNK